MPAFFRAPALDAEFQADRLVPSLVETMAGLGIDLESQAGVTLDVEPRPKKSPRAFCAPVRVPDEIYLVIAPHGGRDDFDALFHEAGHTEHYAHVDRELPAEERYFGDNSITEGFAFLFEHLTSSPAWLERRLGVSDPEPIVRHARASKLMFLRRYAAKLRYELELHDAGADLDAMPGRYAELLGERRGRGVASGHLAQRRGRLLLRRALPARVGPRDPPAADAARSASARPGSSSRRPATS